MSFLIVLGIAAFVYLALRRGPLSGRFPKETHSMIRFPDGQMVHDPDCRQGVCGRRRVSK